MDCLNIQRSDVRSYGTSDQSHSPTGAFERMANGAGVMITPEGTQVSPPRAPTKARRPFEMTPAGGSSSANLDRDGDGLASIRLRLECAETSNSRSIDSIWSSPSSLHPLLTAASRSRPAASNKLTRKHSSMSLESATNNSSMALTVREGEEDADMAAAAATLLSVRPSTEPFLAYTPPAEPEKSLKQYQHQQRQRQHQEQQQQQQHFYFQPQNYHNPPPLPPLPKQLQQQLQQQQQQQQQPPPAQVRRRGPPRKSAVQAQALVAAAVKNGAVIDEEESDEEEDEETVHRGWARGRGEGVKTLVMDTDMIEEGEEEDDDNSVLEASFTTSKMKNKKATKGSNGHHRRAPDEILDLMTDFWRSKGLSSKSQIDKLVALAHTRKLYSDPPRIDLKLHQLRTMLPGADVVKIVCNAPNVLVYDLALSIPPKLHALQSLLPGCDVVKVIVSSPHLLTFNVELNIAPKVQQLRRLLPGVNIVKIISSAPNLLSYDIEGSLSHKVHALFHLLPGADVVKLISYAPTLLYHDTEASIAPKLRALALLLPGIDVVKMVCAAPPLLCSDIEGSIARKLLWMSEMVNGTEEELHEKIESNPRLLTCGYGVVFGRLEFIAKDKGEHVSVKELRSMLLAPVSKFVKLWPGYPIYLAQQLVNAEWSLARGRDVHEVVKKGAKHLEREYGNCLRNVVNKD